VPRQRCWAHKLRNLASRLRRKDKAACLEEARSIYQASTRREAVGRYRQWKVNWQEKAPGAVACLSKDLEEMLAFLDCPRSHWRKIRTTNAIERAFREVRRRTRAMSCFQNPASVALSTAS
jgi:transposase-like protein